ncbi:MAG: hypothetical protein LBF16_08685 [Pseudomonadales bacterium]|jgi:hypothetical protein|nr:hypothetical protein [Pseudomonadales bacterium]
MNISLQKRLLTMVIVVAGLLGFWQRSAAADVEVALDLYDFAGDIDAAQRDALLHDPRWTVSAAYAPPLKLPGLTASWRRCGFFSMPCLEGEDKEITLTGDAITREGSLLRFTLPKRLGFLRYGLSYISIELAMNPYDPQTHLETYFFVADEQKASRAPIIIDGGSFRLAGSLELKGARFGAGILSNEAYLGVDAQGRYHFAPVQRFALYRNGYQFTLRGVALREPLPEELRNKKIYHATLDTREVAGHRIERIDISARELDECNGGGSFDYEIQYVDGEPISYAHSFLSTDPCRGHYQGIQWDDNFRPSVYMSILTEFDSSYATSTTYAAWDVGCGQLEKSDIGRCVAPPPSVELETEIKNDAQRVRGWFP